jgi:hypothetical protein
MSKKEGPWAMSENERDKEGIKHVMSTSVRVKTCLRRNELGPWPTNKRDKEGIKYVLSMNVRV